ncbi:unnamed protein product [Withania somnifera]
MDQQVYFSGMLSNDPKSNPEFYNWNRVYVRYCDGGSFTGDVEAVNPDSGLHYRGARIFKAIMEELLAQGMNTSKTGGLTTILHCDNFRTLLPKSAKVKCFSDAGYFVNIKDISGKAYIEQYFNDIVTLHGSAKNLPPSCTSKLEPGLCFFPQNVAQQIQTPLFIINAAYDYWQVRSTLIAPHTDPKGAWKSCKSSIRNCTPQQLKVLHGFRLDLLKALKGLGPSSTRGYYINSCFSHCQTLKQPYWFGPNSPRLFNKTIAEAVRDWFLDTDQFRHIDCPYPCDKTCV